MKDRKRVQPGNFWGADWEVLLLGGMVGDVSEFLRDYESLVVSKTVVQY